MIEKNYNYKISDKKTIERLVSDENVDINHMIFQNGEGLPQHFANSHLYMIVVRGTISLTLDSQQTNSYQKGSILNIPFKTKMNVENKNQEVCEIFVIKAPSPKTMK